MTSLRRFAYLALGVAFAHLVFGAIVRISGSGMGCGPNWPKCYGAWFPALSQPTVAIEWTHRLLASIVTIAVVVLAAGAGLRGREPGVGGRGGVLRSALLAMVVVAATALLGMVTVEVGNAPWATVMHLLLGMTLLAALAATVIRAGGLGGACALAQRASPRAARGAIAAAGIALVIVALGGLTAKIPGANTVCQGFPLCSGSLLPKLPAQHVQMTHRIFAYLLFFHSLGLVIGFTRRREAPVVVRAAQIAFGLVVLQIVIAASMVELHLPAALRSLHQAVGVSIWLAFFTLAYLAWRASRLPARREAGVADAASAGNATSGSSSASPATFASGARP